jgi:oligoendopeptidase F
VEKILRPERKFIPEDFELEKWHDIEPFFIGLLERPIDSISDLEQWFQNLSELEGILSENLAWRYIKMTCDTSNEAAVASYQFFITEISPKAAPYGDKLNKKALESPFINQLTAPGYEVMLRNMKMEVKIFREENIPLQTEIQSKAQEYGQISGAMSIEKEGKELTLQQAAVFLQSTDRTLRERIYREISGRSLQDTDALNDLFSSLVGLRQQVASNAGYTNFRDYMFDAMGRFDYTPQDCFDFHESVQTAIVPMLNRLASQRKDALKVEPLRPWDKAVDTSGKDPLKPFKSGDDLLDKSIRTFSKLDTYLGERLAIMNEMGHLDLESRKGKAPGGYNYPLAEIGVPFIFMNATSTLRDMVTLMHEGGHAVHSFLTKDLPLGAFKNTPSEVAELASMSMELLSMEYWDQFFNPEDLKRAKREHLEQIIETLPWVANIDKFQHWIYENPGHSIEERRSNWNRIFDEFSDDVTDWGDLQEIKDFIWQKQLHLFEVPFYYIEYGMAQLGAIAVWKNFKENPRTGLQDYLHALQLGNTTTIPEIYSAAGIKFDFSKGYISELMAFVKAELDKLEE